ncbi:MAG: 50S ribosomal protein L2, partial [Candidatus Omnitrophica bacterium]|nr:50S ribosomal protein L2 [Candidatus Omnitrophota bacterium]
MALKTYKPITPSRRGMTTSSFDEITTDKPYKPLTIALRKTGGRNAHGHVTAKYRGGGHKQRYRIVDFKRNKYDMKAKVLSIEYDPNRSARIALVEYEDKEKRYIIWPNDIKVGDEVISSERADIKTGNCLKLKNIPLGTLIHNLELFKGAGAQVVRSAGSSAQILAKESDKAHVKMPSGEIRLIDLDCYATIGQVGNVEHNVIAIGKAGRSRWMGIRPRVRARAMNPVDHPLGGGEGKAAGGRHPCSASGQKSKGLKTRRSKKYSS